MKNAKHTRADFQQSLNDLSQKYEKILQSLDQKDSHSAVIVAESVSKEAENIFSQMANDYLEALYAYRFPKFFSDQEMLANWAKQDKLQLSEEDVINVFSRLEVVLQHLKSEVKRRYPAEPLWKKVWGQYRKYSVGVLVGIVILATAFTIKTRVWFNNHGLMGQYFEGTNFEKQTEQRLDHEINFNWGMGSPFPGWKKDFFSVRWTGYVRTPAKGNYEFVTSSDDGVRLWIDNQLVVENWTNHATKTNRGGIFLTKGLHDIKMDYYEYNNPAVIRLYWKHHGMSSPKIISTRYFTPTKSE